MMRSPNRLTAIVMALLASLSLTACGEKPQQQPENPPVQMARPMPQTATQTREQNTTLTYFPEGEETSVEGLLYSGDGYSLYIPSEGWNLASEQDDGQSVQTWENQLNQDVELQVVYLSGRDQKAARSWVRAEEDDYQFDQEQGHGLSGKDTLDHKFLNVRFFETEQGSYLLMERYPEEAAEGFGTLLSVLADTMEVTA